METARVIEHEGFQLVLLPRSVHLDSSEVTVEIDHGKLVLTPRAAPEPATLADVARHLRENFNPRSQVALGNANVCGVALRDDDSLPPEPPSGAVQLPGQVRSQAQLGNKGTKVRLPQIA